MKIDKENYRDVELIRKNCIKIHAFGLGFIQIKLNKDENIHLYTSRVKKTVGKEEIHTHVRSFDSVCLQGKITNYIYGVCPVSRGDYELVRTSCQPDFTPSYREEVEIYENIRFEIVAGSRYSLEQSVFHRAEAEEGTITHVTKQGEPLTKFGLANVVRPKKTIPICPFSANVFTEEELWQIYASFV